MASSSGEAGKVSSSAEAGPLDIDELLGADHGRLDNGLHYYVKTNSTPEMTEYLCLVVKIGSIVEDEDEYGVAHVIEHLAYGETSKYKNVFEFLRTSGVESGVIHARTSHDSTIYPLPDVSLKNPEVLCNAISVLAEISTEIQVSAEGLDKERGIILDEHRTTWDLDGRMSDAFWTAVMDGSKYTHVSIGSEKVLRNLSPKTVKEFYGKWYQLCNMAVVAVGDFSDTKNVVDLIRIHFGSKVSPPGPHPIPEYPLPFHNVPHFSCLVEPESDEPAVMIAFKMLVDEYKTLKGFRDMLVHLMFLSALKRRFDVIFHARCHLVWEDSVHPMDICKIVLSEQMEPIETVESILLEIARIRLHGFTEWEVSDVRASLMSAFETAYSKRKGMDSKSLCNQYIEFADF
ncbi:Peptidase M16 [Macleaya cordata]|uniref:Peptidase M16 n=1 Tax=Macleaya cordata TaxID=56857 RepID=A0A200R8A5_MACCD|nr:Peptidase M16 [Macleaya cordata]OVA18930.1 Peptidase M16 [Macleaya cordata]